ncbi:MAG: hypothetical protein OHK0019_00260 [Saprospiraceae bacterium]
MTTVTIKNKRTHQTRTMSEDEYRNSEVYSRSRNWQVVSRSESKTGEKPVAPPKTAQKTVEKTDTDE